MKKRIIWLMFVLVIAGIVLRYYSKNANIEDASVPDEIIHLYSKFVQAGVEGDSHAFVSLQHFEIPEAKELSETYFIPVLDWEILNWEKLSNELWVVESNIHTADDLDSGIYYHFVGLIDEKYYIMVSTIQIPPKLKEGLDVSKYELLDAVPFDDIIQ